MSNLTSVNRKLNVHHVIHNKIPVT